MDAYLSFRGRSASDAWRLRHEGIRPREPDGVPASIANYTPAFAIELHVGLFPMAHWLLLYRQDFREQDGLPRAFYVIGCVTTDPFDVSRDEFALKCAEAAHLVGSFDLGPCVNLRILWL